MSGRRVLVAGVGNVFLGDDGFGPAVLDRLGERPLPDGVRAVDYGIRGVHLSFDLLDDWDALVLVDALPGEGPAGELRLLEVTDADLAGVPPLGAHGVPPPPPGPAPRRWTPTGCTRSPSSPRCPPSAGGCPARSCSAAPPPRS